MASVKSGKKPPPGVPGVKLLIAASSVAATVGGWALISATETTPAPPAQIAAQAVAPQAAAPALSIQLPPLPTLVPALRSQPQIVTVNQGRAASAPRPAAIAAQPEAPQPALVLRDVSAPASAGPSASAPAPAANTRSSK